MIQSIYIKNCLNYFIVIIVSLILSFLITSLFFQNQIIKIREAEVIGEGKGMIHLYQALGDNGFNKYLKSVSNLPYEIYIYNQSGFRVTLKRKKVLIEQ